MARLSLAPVARGSPLGGLARRGAWVQSVRETSGQSLLLDSGDLFFDRYRRAIPPENVVTQSEKAHLILKCYNLLGYDALGIGDDDLSLGRISLSTFPRKLAFPLFLRTSWTRRLASAFSHLCHPGDRGLENRNLQPSLPQFFLKRVGFKNQGNRAERPS